MSEIRIHPLNGELCQIIQKFGNRQIPLEIVKRQSNFALVLLCSVKCNDVANKARRDIIICTKLCATSYEAI
jgi:hypothetical protein